MTNERKILARTELVDYGTYGEFVVTGFARNGDVISVIRPSKYGAIYIGESDPTKILFWDSSETIQWITLTTPELAQSVLNAIGERKTDTFYYDTKETT